MSMTAFPKCKKLLTKHQGVSKENIGLKWVNKTGNGLTLQDALECVKQHEKHVQREKSKIINIAYKQRQILHQCKESEEFINT